MPGKVNPTQVEALTMVCLRVMGNNTAVTMAASQGQFQLNVYKPLIIHSLLESMELLADAMSSFREHCLEGIEPIEANLLRSVERSLMSVTALSPVIGYEQAAKLAKYAQTNDVGLKEAGLALGLLSEKEFDALLDARKMLFPLAGKPS